LLVGESNLAGNPSFANLGWGIIASTETPAAGRGPMDDRSPDTPPTDAPSADGAAPPTPPGGRPRRNRLVITMMAATALLLVGAIAATVVGLQAQSDAADRRNQATAALAASRKLAREASRLELAREDLEKRARLLPGHFDNIGITFQLLATAHGRLVDVLNRAAALYNAGNAAGALALLQSDGPPALSELQSRKAEAQEKVQNAEDAIHSVQEKL
jgi:hypothetical protein